MQHTFVSSSNLKSVGYDAPSSILEVAFLNGGLYSYSGVPSSVYVGLMAAASKGEYFSSRIKDRYPTRKLR